MSSYPYKIGDKITAVSTINNQEKYFGIIENNPNLTKEPYSINWINEKTGIKNNTTTYTIQKLDLLMKSNIAWVYSYHPKRDEEYDGLFI